MVDFVFKIKSGLMGNCCLWGVYFFIGFIGIGKIEMVKMFVVYFYGDEFRLVCFDMSEYVIFDVLLRFIGDCYRLEGVLILQVCQ